MNCILCQRLNAYENQFHLIVQKEEGNLIYEVHEANFCGTCLIEAFSNKKAFAVCTSCKSVFTFPRESFTFRKAGEEITMNAEELNALVVRLVNNCELCGGGNA